MDRSAMLYSKVKDVSIMPPGSEYKKFTLQMDEAGKTFTQDQPLLLPSIMGYSTDQNAQNSIAGTHNNKKKAGPSN